MVIKLRYGVVAAVLSALMVLTAFFFLIDDMFSINTNSAEHKVILPIIMYHEVKTFKAGKDVITPYEFESDLKFLKAGGYTTVTMTELIDYVYHDKELPQKPVIVSFDDGYLNNYHYVLPLLKKYDMKIVFSIIGKNTDDFTRIPDRSLDYSHVTWDQLNEMIQTGLVEVQNHTYDLHKDRGRLGVAQKPGETLEQYEKILTEDIAKFQEKITELTGSTPNTFVYPYGKSTKNTDTVLKKIGFLATLSCDYGVNRISKDPEELFGLKRICRAHGQSVESILKKVLKTPK